MYKSLVVLPNRRQPPVGYIGMVCDKR